MKVLVVYAHPNPKSFNHALLEIVTETLSREGNEVRVKDLYAEGFNPVLSGQDFEAMHAKNLPADIQKEQEAVAWAEGLVFVYPTWWFERPAILKGWIDRVLLPGFAYEFTDKGPKGLLKHSRALVIQTTGGDEAAYERNRAKELIYRPMTDGTLAFCGIPNVVHKVFYQVPTVPDPVRKAMLEEAKKLVSVVFSTHECHCGCVKTPH